MSETTALKIAAIERDMLLQPRAELHRDWIEDYAHDMAAGAAMPPIVVFFDGEKYWLADGFHRTYAAEAAGLSEILADVRSGTRRDAMLFSVGANAEHGHRRTNEDKRRAVDIMLNDPQWSRWGDDKIAEQIGVHRTTVLRRREELSSALHKITETKRLVSRNGTTYEMDTSRIGVRDEWAVAPPVPSEAAPEPFDWEAARLRNAAMEAIRALAALPSPYEVIAAWMKSSSYGEPMETFDQAMEWLSRFAALYRAHEPRRWFRVQQQGGMINAAE